MRIVRSLAYLLCLTAVVHAQAQTTQTSRILTVYTNLRAQDSQYLSLSGQAQTGSTTDTVKVEAYYKYTPSTTIGAAPTVDQIDLQLSRNGTLVLRLIGDGQLFRSYNYQTKSFWVAPYLLFDSNAKAFAINHAVLMESLGIGAAGEAAYVARLLREVYGDPSTAYYSSWLPGVTPTDGAYDPENQTTYPQGVTYTFGTPATREIGFVIDQDQTTNALILKAVSYYDVHKLGGQSRTTQWVLDVEDVATVPTYLDFTPPTVAQLSGWRQVVRPVPVSH